MEGIELDERMTDETKTYVIEMLKNSIRQKSLDPDLMNEAMNAAIKQVNSSLNFDTLKVQEIKVKNSIDNYEIPVSVYIPEGVKPNSPITIFYHGGGWTILSRQSHFYGVASLAEITKTVWLSVEYRLLPKVKFPELLSDCQSVLEYVSQNKKEFSSEEARLLVCGDSAGGHISAILSNENQNLIDAQVLIYPVLDFSSDYDEIYKEFSKPCYLLDCTKMNMVQGLFFDGPFINSAAVSPLLKEDLTKTPRTLLIAAQLDPLCEHSIRFYKRLQENSVQSHLKIINGTVHSFFNFPAVLPNAFHELKEEVSKLYQSL